MGIGKTLSTILNEKNVKPNELAERLGITPSTIYSIIKRDNTKVDITVLARICKELGVEMERFYQDYISEQIDKKAFFFSDNEKKMVQKYRSLDNIGKEFVDVVIEHELERCSEQNTGDSEEPLMLSVVAARSEENKTKIHTELMPDLSKFTPDDSDL